jgi:hypothetical protein
MYTEQSTRLQTLRESLREYREFWLFLAAFFSRDVARSIGGRVGLPNWARTPAAFAVFVVFLYFAWTPKERRTRSSVFTAVLFIALIAAANFVLYRYEIFH